MRVTTNDNARKTAGVEEKTSPGRLFQNDLIAASETQRLDEEREARIDVLRLQFLAAKTADDRRVIWRDYRAEINARSPAQVRRMEIESGLCATQQ